MATGTPTRVLLNNSEDKLIFTTDNDKLNICGTTGQNHSSVDFTGGFSVDSAGNIWGMELDTTLKISKYNEALSKSTIVTTLATDTVCLKGFSISNYTYLLNQSATDNNVKITRVDNTDDSYSSLTITGVTYNTVVKYYSHYTSDGYYAFIHTSGNGIYRVDLTDFTTITQMRQESKNTDGTIITVVDNFGDTGSFESIATTGLQDDPTGDIQNEVF
ncbi:MAG: hypothetical protein OMM_05979 [Candidatus Magnetoglobus multicellularis str. Araruama]|uniref:Uncharacterized protein n=1 Tax=Candidatus Magnetoglobus multicellularis str. Araruama TaxID=890399 RepID=A0A1V1NSQ2_9BACT|nr:MAG: hypothetical protein OMM_05979 [Candidatus Magnetoglobus multicellularis str. Araruama]